MSPPKGFAAMPTARFLRGDKDPDVRANNQCRDVGGTHFCVGAQLSLGHVGDTAENDTGIGLLFVTNRGGDHGYSVALTSKAMRGLAGALEEMANMVDASAAKAAGDALDRAKAAGK